MEWNGNIKLRSGSYKSRTDVSEILRIFQQNNIRETYIPKKKGSFTMNDFSPQVTKDNSKKQLQTIHQNIA